MREPSAIDQIADAHARRLAELQPTLATMIGIGGYDHLLDDLSPAGHARIADLNRATLAELDRTPATDATDEVTVAAMRDRLGLDLELYEAGEYRAHLDNISSPVQGLRDILDLTPTDTPEQWADVASRLSRMPEAIDGYVACLREGIETGLMPSRRAVAAALAQADELADPASSFFVGFVAGADADGALAVDLQRAGATAAAAYGRLAAFLRDELGPRAPEADAVGRERYQRLSRLFVGATIDLDETYEWGLEELARVAAEQDALAERIAGPGASIVDAAAVLDADPTRILHGTDALQVWMQQTSDAAIEALDGVHFDIDPKLKTLQCRIAPTHNGGIYYTGPTDDFSRPGRMWWSVPPGVTQFGAWREKTTVYHEGVPGHHLQIGQATLIADRLNLWRRQLCWMSGHGEGWALYAERLMEEFGFLDDEGDRFGMLDGQRLRATRVVFDLGVHLGKTAPAAYGGGTWDADKGWELLRRNVMMDEGFLRFEWTRYLTWAGQAPSYKVGQRIWQDIRAEAAAAAAARGEEFSLRDFHARALNLGAVPLDVLRDQLVG